MVVLAPVASTQIWRNVAASPTRAWSHGITAGQGLWLAALVCHALGEFIDKRATPAMVEPRDT